MSTVLAELQAVQALQDYLRMALPAKVASINTARAASITLKREPYSIPDVGLYTVTTNAGAFSGGWNDATTLGADALALEFNTLNLLNGAGLTATVTSDRRVVLTCNTVPVVGTSSILSIVNAADDTGDLMAALGLPSDGVSVTRAALVAPSGLGVHDGLDPQLMDFGQGFWVLLGQRTTAPRDANIRTDVSRTRLQLQVYAAEPNGSTTAAQEYVLSAVRAVREVIFADRSLDNRVFMTRLDSVTSEARTFRFTDAAGASPLFSLVEMWLSIDVYERS